MPRSPIGPKDRVFITGGNSGIGAGLAATMHARGAAVTISGRDQGRLDAVASQYPGMRTLIMDVSDPDSVDAAAAETSADAQPLTMLVNNAGVQRLADFAAPETTRHRDFASDIETNLTGLVHVTAAFLPALRRAPRARLVNVSSGLAFIPLTQANSDSSGGESCALGWVTTPPTSVKAKPRRQGLPGQGRSNVGCSP